MPMYKKQLFVLIILLLAAAGGTYYGLYSEEQAVVLDAAATAESSPPKQEITVYVTGAVNKPGLVKVPEGARAADAVNACGGLLPTADGEKINMAQSLKDGQQLKVPEKTGTNGKTDSGKTDKSKGADSGEKVNINTADEKALDTLPGVGPAMAKRIIEYRETEGAFQSIEDIKKIRGIGEAKFAKMKDRICI
ncbi:helix-hairpin-helix domain-containing protein [Selenomonas ruminantium]|uniref:helix-hairpin-helix domain-containing protein n=1 Tax=Selenomonas ruminantium TaxID=971 RepID=UPI00041D3541|nr:helix-hairpin-helix domain-containing protein [Selenomonas ruminantium]